ncbi:hypothetical protein GCM10022285_63870 [Streptomyces tunisiensis]|uniref:Uncharacterized protein n=1 Tax=Streptomyces tunisiensis TaxID=948699 RepID=A0ABP7ZAZ8_9ACTN
MGSETRWAEAASCAGSEVSRHSIRPPALPSGFDRGRQRCAVFRALAAASARPGAGAHPVAPAATRQVRGGAPASTPQALGCEVRRLLVRGWQNMGEVVGLHGPVAPCVLALSAEGQPLARL